jgi:hypothetical protein
MTIKPSFSDKAAWLAAKPGGYFVSERWGTGHAINIHRTGCPVETILVGTEGERNRIRLALSDDGLTGYIADEQPVPF